MPSWLSDILIGLITSIIGSLSFTIFSYFRFLRKIPQETEDKINKLLNDRLGYESNNHNTVMTALSPDNRQLADEHWRIQEHIHSIMTNIEILKEKGKADYSLLNDSGKRIADNVEELRKFVLLFTEMNSHNNELQKENQKLERRIELLLCELEELQIQLGRQNDQDEYLRPEHTL